MFEFPAKLSSVALSVKQTVMAKKKKKHFESE